MVVLSSLSPSRANDFQLCPLKYRFRTVDRLPEPPSKAALKGTLVHAALEALFDLPAPDRLPAAARELLAPAWERLLEEDPARAELFETPEELGEWTDQAAALVDAYFSLELPERLEPAGREERLEAQLEGGPLLRGFVDRIDIAPGGELRVVDYKTGRQPAPRFAGEAQFQMRFYGVLVQLTREVLPHTLQLMYLGSRTVVRHRPEPQELDRTRERILGVWSDIRRCAETGTWAPQTSKLCGWCHFKPICPAWGNTPPPSPEVEVA